MADLDAAGANHRIWCLEIRGIFLALS
jgi:hypothetical protein